MDSRKLVLQETAIMAVGEAIGVAVMLGIFALLGQFDRTVLLGGLFGGVLTTLNHFFLSMGVMMAADRAAGDEGQIKPGMTLVRLSFGLRMVLLFVILFALLKSGLCNVFALLIPLLFAKPILLIGGFFRKDGEAKS